MQADKPSTSTSTRDSSTHTHSHTGNVLFPYWEIVSLARLHQAKRLQETIIPTAGTNSWLGSWVSLIKDWLLNDKGRLLNNKGWLLKIKRHFLPFPDFT